MGQELARVHTSGDVFVAVQDGGYTTVYDSTGYDLITFFGNSGANIDASSLTLIVETYLTAFQRGVDAGTESARRKIRASLGVQEIT